MTNTMTVFGRITILVGLLALAGCGQDQSGESETAPESTSAQATDTSEKMAAAEEQSQSSSTDSGKEASDSVGSDADMSDAASTEDSADSGGESYTITARATAFDPVVLQINPGDNINWTNMSGHNVHFEAGNIPEGAETWQTSLGDNVNKTFTKEGIYLYKCDPHFAMGMVGAIIVGKPTNLAQVEENAKGMYKRALAKATAQL